MLKTDNEQEIMQLIVNGGDARSGCLKAIQKAEEGEIEEALILLENANASLNKAHESQTKLIQSEIRGEGVELNLLMIHAQDHVMNAMTVRDLAKYIIHNCQEINQLKKQLKESEEK
ncbi:PTS lactose/cellobiose transporter subunit IIA [Enterococcus sp. LJL99]